MAESSVVNGFADRMDLGDSGAAIAIAGIAIRDGEISLGSMRISTSDGIEMCVVPFSAETLVAATNTTLNMDVPKAVKLDLTSLIEFKKYKL
jgi:hypothetical protein